MGIRYVDDGYFFTNEFDFYEFINEDNIKDYTLINKREFWEDRYNDTIKNKLPLI